MCAQDTAGERYSCSAARTIGRPWGHPASSAAIAFKHGQYPSPHGLQELQQQSVDLAEFLLLYPMAGTLDQMDAAQSRAANALHSFDRARRLINAPVAGSGDE